MGRGYRGGFGQGRGSGPGFRHGYGHYQYESFPDVSEKTLIENEIRILKDQMSAMKDRESIAVEVAKRLK